MLPTRRTKKKVLVIGIDGGTLDVVMPMVEEGKMVNLGKLLDKGSYGVLNSTIPPVTAPAWSSFITGTNPARHGVFSFFQRSGSQRDTLVNFRHIKATPFWRTLNANGVKVGLVNIPLTYPPDKVDGFMISGIPVPSRSKDFAYPPAILSKLNTYHVDLDGLMVNNKWRGKKLVKENRELFLQNVFNLSRNRTQNVLALMKTEPWDFFMVVFTGSDRICHFFWKDRGNRKSPSPVVEKYYNFLDSMIGKLFNEAGEETIKLVISDHGFGPAPRKRINTFVLARLLDIDGQGWHPWPTCLKKILLAKIGLGKRPTMEDLVDPEKYRFLIKPMYANFLGITINSKYDNEAQITTVGENSATLQEIIINKLEGLTDPISGERIVERIASRESLYQGPYAERAPNLVVQLSYDYGPVFSPSRKRLVYDVGDLIRSGEHRLEGLLIAGGPFIKSGRLARDLFIQDVTPTILYLLNTPIPETYDGRLITELFTEDYLTANKPRFRAVEPQAEVPSDEPDHRDQGEFEESKKLLENLGYL